MKEYIKGDIHKLIVGDGTESYTVGKDNTFIDSKIVEIIQDKPAYEESGHFVFYIVCEDKNGIRWQWCEVVNKPYTLQYAKPTKDSISNNY